jgi:DNA ligase 1
MSAQPRFVTIDDVKAFDEQAGLSSIFRSVGRWRLSDEYVEGVLGIPLHLRFAIEGRLGEGKAVADDALASIPFYSLCKGLFLPLSMLQPEAAAHYFGIQAPAPPDMAAREALLQSFLQKDVGLSLVQKLACILGDPFCGRRSTFKRDSMLTLLLSLSMKPRREMLDRLAQPGVGDIAVLFAQERPAGKLEPALTAAEVLEALRLLPPAPRALKFGVLRSLLSRMGKLEAYFLAKLLLRKAGFGFDYQGPLVARALAEAYSRPGRQPVDSEQVAHAIALTDAFKVASVLEEEGADGLRKIHLQPLVPIRPALAMQGDAAIPKLPVFVERKYDGIRLMLHKTTDALGNVLVGAYTRTRGDWLEDIAGLSQMVRALPCRSCIVDAELHGTVLDLDDALAGGSGGRRPATVYDILGHIGGQPQKPLKLRCAAFDLVYWNGQDLTQRPLRDRRALLQALLEPVAQLPFPVPIELSEGYLAASLEEVNRHFHHHRNQGYEGIIAKDLDGPYRIAQRDPTWVKRKPLETLDLVLLGGVFAVTTKERTSMFGSWVIGARRPDGSFEDVGDVAGVDIERDQIIQQTILREGLITGRRIERASTSGVRPGLELRPHLVVTVKCEGTVKDAVTKKLSLRDPKIVVLRADKSAGEADTTQALEELYRKERLG